MRYGYAKEGRPLARIEPLVKHSYSRARLCYTLYPERRGGFAHYSAAAQPVLPLVCKEEPIDRRNM